MGRPNNFDPFSGMWSFQWCLEAWKPQLKTGGMIVLIIRLISLSNIPNLTLYSINTQFDVAKWTAFENIVGKEEIAHNEQFLLFPQCFLLNQVTVPPFVHIFDIILLFATELEVPKIGIWGKGLKQSYRRIPLKTLYGKEKLQSAFSSFPTMLSTLSKSNDSIPVNST